MELVVKGNLNKRYFAKIEQKLQQLLPVPNYIEKIFFTDHIKHAAAMFRNFPKTIGREFAHEFERSRTSMSFVHGEAEIIIMLITKTNAYMGRNQRACIGALAHEIVHVLHGREGLNEYVDKCFESNFPKYYAKITPLKLSNTETATIAASIGSLVSYLLKDLYMIQELISRGMGDYVLEDYYKLMLTLTKSPKFYSDFRTASREQILNAINFELSILTAVLPFETYPNLKAKKLVQAIHTRYEKYIPEVVKEFLALDRLYDEEFSWSWDFQRKFFTEIFVSSASLLMRR